MTKVSKNTAPDWFEAHILKDYRLPKGVSRIPKKELKRLKQEMFAVPTSFYEGKITKAPPSQKPDYILGANRLP